MQLMVLAILSALMLGPLGCRGYTTADPPFHVNPNMDTQERGKAYRESDFFADKMYMRMPIEGTVARGQLKEDEHFYFGKVNGLDATSLPKNLVIDEAFLERGKIVYNRTCATCHGASGDGDGLVGRRLLVKPTNFHTDYLYDRPPGHYFDAASNGIRTMLGYRQILSTLDIWGAAVWVRVLQLMVIDEKITRRASWWKQI